MSVSSINLKVKNKNEKLKIIKLFGKVYAQTLAFNIKH
jgi:hypothetical protein